MSERDDLFGQLATLLDSIDHLAEDVERNASSSPDALALAGSVRLANWKARQECERIVAGISGRPEKPSFTQDETEEWRPVCGWEEVYEVSSLGRIRSLDRYVLGRWVGGVRVRVLRRGRLLRFAVNRHGYLVSCFTQDSKRVNVEAHRVVCETFHGKAPYGAVAAHWDGVRTNNRAANLRWATPSENQLDRHRHGTIVLGTEHHAARLTPDAIRTIRKSSLGHTALARLFDVDPSTISAVRKGETWQHIDASPLSHQMR